MIEGVYLVDIEQQCHKFGRSLRYATLGYHDGEHESVYQLLYELLTHSFSISPVVLLLLD